MDKLDIKRNIEDSFRSEVAYLQSGLCAHDFMSRELQWLSLHTVVAILGVKFEIEGLHDGIGFSSNMLYSYKPRK